KIVEGVIPANKIYENDSVLGFLDIAPVNVGHSLVIPKQHYKNIYETPEEVMLDMIKAVKTLSKAIKNGLEADGINVTMNNDPAAGQIIFHSHIHIIPRVANDGFGMWHGKRPYQEGEKEVIVKKITAAL
ncbi:HIT domain-containing protein, partial [Candidatus Nomurabacteria bacterium]|nr:HIT domain-containing protein [Candidatus Nomurabacteria bacterium]